MSHLKVGKRCLNGTEPTTNINTAIDILDVTQSQNAWPIILREIFGNSSELSQIIGETWEAI